MGFPNVLIVDDEELSADGLAKFIQNSQIPVERPIIRYSGFDALEYIQKNQIDILITDIKMPGMDGLELINQIKQVQLEMQVMILTGFGSLDYAKRAMRYGVKYFLQKPIIPRQILDDLSNCMSDLTRVNREILLHDKQLFEEALLGMEFLNNHNVPKFTMLQFFKKHYRNFQDALSDYISTNGYQELMIESEGVVANVIFATGINIDFVSDRLKSTINQGLIVITDNLDLVKFSDAFGSGKTTLEREFYFDDYHLLVQSDKLIWGDISYQIFDEVTNCYTQNEFTKGKLIFDQIMAECKQEQPNISKMKQVLIVFLNKLLKRNNIFNENELRTVTLKIQREETFHELLEGAHSCLTMYEQKANVDDIKNSISTSLNLFIEKYYSNESLSLRWISKNELFFSPEYLGKIFYQERKIKFSRRLKEVRIEKSKQYLVEGHRVSEVARLVGFGDNSEYFIRCFKSIVGVTPHRYYKNNI